MKTIVIEATQCPSCGNPISAGSLAGLCPTCLLAQGLGTDAGGGRRGPFVPPPLEEVAKLFPQLEILGLLGAGGMGAVYKARQPALDRIVALKILPSHSEEGGNFTERFNREARALARLSHPNIVAVFEFGQAGALGFFIMEFVDGANLRQLEKAGRLAPREALQIIPQICDALQYAHDEGVVHRDIKPENVLVDRKGRVKIADFGLAKILGQDAESLRLTAEGQVMGTPHYMAPEQIEKPLTVDHRADIYSLGVVLYEMLTGDLPLGKFAPPSRKYQLDVRLDEVVLRALENDPARRYQHASEVKTQMENIAGTPAPKDAASRPEQNRIYWAGFPVVIEREGGRKVNRKEAWKALGILFGVLTIGFGLVSLLAGRTLYGWLGNSGWLSLVVRLSVAGLVTAIGVWCALRSKTAERKPLQTPQGTVLLPPERFSRKAIFGACLAPFALVAAAMFFMTWTVPQPSEAATHVQPTTAWWQILLMVAVALPGLLAPFGTTILGWLAVADIRRSRGRISGLPLAVFDGLIFPLIALDGVLIWAWIAIVELLQQRAVFDSFHAGEVSILTKLGAAAICVLVNIFIVRRVWSAVRLSGDGPRVGGAWWWNRTPAALLIGLASVGLIAANIWRLEKSAAPVRVQQRITAPDAKTGTFMAKLPDRGIVELLAVSGARAASNEWWLPNGTPIPDMPYEFDEIGNVDFNGWTNKDIVFRWSDLPADASGPYLEFEPSGAYSSGGKSWRDAKKSFGTRPVRAAFPLTATEATMRVGFDFAAWQTVSTHDRNGNSSSVKAPPGVPDLHAQVHRVGENNGQAFVTLSLARESRDWRIRVVAVDTNGMEHADHLGTSIPSDKNAVMTYDFLRLPLARVQEFRVQVRPVYWVEFRDVALRRRSSKPNAKSESALETTPPSSNSLGGLVQRLSGGALVELIAVSDPDRGTNGWWRHDGTPVTNLTLKVGAMRRDPEAFQKRFAAPVLIRDVVLSIKGLPKGAGYFPRFELLPSAVGSSGGREFFANGTLVADCRVFHVAFPETATTAVLSLRLELEPWRTVCVHRLDGSPDARARNPDDPDWNMTFGAVTETNGFAQIEHAFVKPKKDKRWNHRLVAIDRAGVEHTPDASDGLRTNFAPMPLASIAEFRVQVRPLHLVEFRDVALFPRFLPPATAGSER